MKNLTSFVNWCSKNSEQVKTRLKLCKNYVRTLTAILLLIFGVGNAWGWVDRTYDGSTKLYILNIAPTGWSANWANDASHELYVQMQYKGGSTTSWMTPTLESGSSRYARGALYSITPPSGTYECVKLKRTDGVDSSTGDVSSTGIEFSSTASNNLLYGYTLNNSSGTWGAINPSPVTSDGTGVLYFNMAPGNPTYIDYDFISTITNNGDGNYAYFFNNSDGKWSTHAEQVSGNYYKITVPAGTWTGVIFTRHGDVATPSWDNVYQDGSGRKNQSTDIPFTGSHNYVSAWYENKYSGAVAATMSDYIPSGEVLLNGTMNGWNLLSAKHFSDGSASISLEAHKTHKFKIIEGNNSTGTYYGLTDYNCIVSTMANWALSSPGVDTRFNTAGAGSYTFEYNNSNHKLSVTYPSVTHPSEDYVYLIAYGDWTSPHIHFDNTSTTYSVGKTTWQGQALTVNDGTITDEYTFGSQKYYYVAVGDYPDFNFNHNNSDKQTGDQTPQNGKRLYNENSAWVWGTFDVTVTLDKENGESDGSVTMTCNSADHAAITNPTKTGYTFAGWFTEDDGEGSLVIDVDGTLQANVTGYTNADGKWIHDEDVTLYARWGREFSLVTDVSQLTEGTEIIITNTYCDRALSTSASADGNRRAATDDISIVLDKVIVPDASPIQVITIEKDEVDEVTYNLFNVGTNSYLNGISGSNYLKINTKNETGYWTITLNGSYQATVTSKVTSKWIQYSSSDSWFSTYSSNPGAIKLYRCSSPFIYVTSDELSSFTYAVGYGPSLTQAVSVKAYNLTGNLTVTCPSGYELSSASPISGFSTSNLTISKDANDKVDATFYIRLAAGNSVGEYDPTLTISGGGIAPKSIELEGEVTTAPSGTAYRIATDATALFPDDEIVITNVNKTHIMSDDATKNNRPGLSADGNFALVGPTIFVTGANVQNLTLEKCDDEWLMKASTNNYLYADGETGSSNNYLKTGAKSLADNGNGNWKTIINNMTGEALVCAPNSSNKKDTIQFYSSSSLFSCYNPNSYQLLKLYAKPSATANVCGYPSKLTDFEVKAAADKYSDAQSFTVKARNITSGNVTITAPDGWEVSLDNSDYDDEIEISPVSNSVVPTTVYARLKSTADKGNHSDTLIISATGATDRKIALEGTVNPLIVTYNSASDAGDHPTVEVSYNESVEAEYTPANCEDDRIFIGWSSAAVATQQTEPTITSTDGKIADIVSDTTLYAVFASRNGSDGHDYADNFNSYDVPTGASYTNTTPRIYDIWSVVNGRVSDITIGTMGSNAIVLQSKDATMTTTKKIHNFTGLTCKIATTHNEVHFKIDYSTDGSIWTYLLGDTYHYEYRTAQTYTRSKEGVPVDAYVRISITAVNKDVANDKKRIYIDDVTLYSKPHDWVLTDYSTSCEKADSPAEISWDNNDNDESEISTGTEPTSQTIGGSITLPTLARANYQFDGFTVQADGQDVAPGIYYAGEEFLINHSVSFTAQWTEIFKEISDPTYGVTSYKDITTTSLPHTFHTVAANTAKRPVVNEISDETHFAVTITGAELSSSDSVYTFTYTYTPDDFGTGSGAATHTATVTFKDPASDAISAPVTITGRSLPEEFVIAVKNGDKWVALPSNLASTQGGQPEITPIPIVVNDASTPTAATYAPSTTAYKVTGRGNDGHATTARFTTTGSNYLQTTGTASSVYKMWLSTTSTANQQDWQLKSEDYNSYELTIPSNTNVVDYKMGIYDSYKMGYHSSPSASDIYLLPITNKFSPVMTEVYEWGEHGVVVALDYLYGVASASMHIEDGDLTDTIPTGVNGTLGSTKFTRVHHKDFTIGTPENEGKQLYIHWKNSGGTEIGVSQITIPCVISSDATMSVLEADKSKWAKKEVHILPDATLTADAASFDDNNVTVPTMYVYPGATLDITSGKLTATTLRLRNGWTRVGETKYDVSRVHIADDAALAKTTAAIYYDIYNSAEGLHYYPLAVPFDVDLTGYTDSVDYANDFLAYYSRYGYDGQYIIKKYNGSTRAQNGAVSYCWQPVYDYETLKPGIGYTITAIPVQGEAIIRFPLNFNNVWTNDGEKGTAKISTTEYRKDTVHVVNYTGTATASGALNHKGWNLLGVPYMSCFATSKEMHSGGEDAFIKGHINMATAAWVADDYIYVTVPTHDFSEYIQSHIEDTELVPGWCFFVQVEDEGQLTFAVSGQQADSDLPIHAPRRMANSSPVTKTGIILTDGTKSDKTTLLISDRYSSDYEINADLEKMFGESFTLSTYSINDGVRLAYNAMSTTDALQAIPLGVRIPQDGQYTFSLNARYADAAIERLDLIDYQEGQITNLMQGAYVFTATQGENETRFALNVTRKAPEITTGMEGVETDSEALHGARKQLINGILYIVRDGVLYDATGKRL